MLKFNVPLSQTKFYRSCPHNMKVAQAWSETTTLNATCSSAYIGALSCKWTCGWKTNPKQARYFVTWLECTKESEGPETGIVIVNIQHPTPSRRGLKHLRTGMWTQNKRTSQDGRRRFFSPKMCPDQLWGPPAFHRNRLFLQVELPNHPECVALITEFSIFSTKINSENS